MAKQYDYFISFYFFCQCNNGQDSQQKSVDLVCQISPIHCAACSLSGRADRLLEVHSSLGCMSWLDLFHVLLFYSSPAMLRDRLLGRAEDEKDGQKRRDGQMGRLHLSSRPPNGHPPRSCVIYARRALAPFIFFPVSAEGSDDLLEGMLSASKTSQSGNK